MPHHTQPERGVASPVGDYLDFAAATPPDAIFPRRTVIEALGRVNVVFAAAIIRERAAGPSGLADPPVVVGCHWYCSLPKVITSTVPEKALSEPAAPSPKLIRTACEFS